MAVKKNAVQLPEPSAAEVEFAQQLVERAKADGVSLVGPGGLLAGITRTVLESALDAELDAHLDEAGVDEATGRRANVRNGHGTKTMQTDVGPVRIQVPRDRAGSFTPQIVPKHVRRLDGFNEAILSLYAKGLTTGEISAHLADVYEADVSRELISRVTDSVLAEMEAWRQRPLDRIYPVVFIDALVMKIRQGQVANRPVYVVVGISLDGERDVLGMWAGTGGEGAKQWAGYCRGTRWSAELRTADLAKVAAQDRGCGRRSACPSQPRGPERRYRAASPPRRCAAAVRVGLVSICRNRLTGSRADQASLSMRTRSTPQMDCMKRGQRSRSMNVDGLNDLLGSAGTANSAHSAVRACALEPVPRQLPHRTT
ncbi:transposase [Micromonospora sp. WMMD1082]|uniref:IS256 family transposase n=1 Tax=Micromonospora sp. WMMD1082 TaxID=3016104 RepID=UPI0024171112|nr:transposase [Micromonospora sp. WMMD1082]MDG4797176.1 transposase [Micromonospora sp. WMMD1082]